MCSRLGIVISMALALLLLAKVSVAGSVEIVRSLPHTNSYFTQGLIVHNGQVTETTGQYGHSLLASYALGEPATVHLKLAKHYFGEGVTELGNHLYWLSWRAGIALKINKHDFSLSHSYRYRGEGWGITHNGKHLIMSNGSNTLQFRNPNTFKTEATVKVHHHGKPVRLLNELEWVNGYVLANIWKNDAIVKIDPATGEVVVRYNLSKLRQTFNDPKAEVLNGIAYDRAQDKLYVTGKYWPKLFEVKLSD